MALICAHVQTVTKALIVPKILTNVKLVRLANTMDYASTPPVHSVAIAPVVSQAPDAKLTSTNAIRTLAKMTALVSTNVVPSAVSACQVQYISFVLESLPGVAIKGHRGCGTFWLGK